MGLFSELRKRKVFATAALYVPGAWLTAEIFIFLADRLGAPHWVGDVVAVLFILGFPVALLLSWLFDITRDGVVRASPGTPLGITVLVACGLFLSVAANISYQVFSGRLSEISVAILPLKTNATNPAAQPYGSGIADSLRSSLQQISVFRVSAHTSSEAVVKAGLDIPGIASKLDVQYIVEGTLEMVGQNLNVSVSLIDNGGNVQWSKRFERATQDIFTLQNDLVRAVALQLGVDESNAQLQRSIRKPAPTQDIEAHRLYLQGKYGSFDMSGSTEESGSMQAFKAALQRDPGYAAIYSAIAGLYANHCWGQDDRRSHLCQLAVNYAEQGLQMDPESGDALATLAYIRAIRYEYPEAQIAIDRLLELPGHKAASGSLSWAYMNLGKIQLSWDKSKEFYRNDPLNSGAVINMALYSNYLENGKDDVERYHQMLIEMTGTSIVSGFAGARIDRVDMQTAIEDMRAVLPLWNISPDYADILVPPEYDSTLRQDSLEKLDDMFARGDLRSAWYWSGLIHLFETDRAVDMAFELYDQGVLNPVMFWTTSGGRREFRSHPRFVDLVEYIGLASYWDEVGWPVFCEARGESQFCGLDIVVQ